LRFGVALLGVALLAGVAMDSPTPAQVPSGRDVVAPSAFASFEPVARGGSFQVAVVLKIRDGFHINARQPSADYLIATDLRTEAPPGFKIGEVAYPQGELRTFSFSKKPLNVYQGNVILRMSVTALPDAPLGAQHIPLKLRYQACSNEVCLPPARLDVNAAVSVASAATAAKPAHSELFQSHP
jgi:thiol:disulfide interchange protein DsbD